MRDNNLSKYLIAISIVIIIVIIILFSIVFKRFRNEIQNTTNSSNLVYSNNSSNLNYTEEEKEEREKINLSNFAINNFGNINIPNLKDINYNKYAKIQFEDPRISNTVVNIKFTGINKIVKIKLFDYIAPKTVNDFLIAVAENRLLNTIPLTNSLGDLSIQMPIVNNSNAFTVADEREYNFSLVPYKGALVRKNVGSSSSEFSIINSDTFENNEKFITGNRISNTLLTEVKNKGARLANIYLKEAVFGQIIEGIEVIDEINNRNSQNIPTQIEKVEIDRRDTRN